jgi:hypothetical protein
MIQSGEVVRARVDALRAAAVLGSELQRQLEQEPMEALASHGLLGHAGVTAPASHEEIRSMHMCPWHTCQATRHGSTVQ